MIDFYKTLSEQHAAQNPGSLYRNLAPVGRVLPFQFIVPIGETNINRVMLVNCNGESDITVKMKEAGIKVVQKKDYNIVMFPAILNVTDKQGTFFLRLETNGATYYSEEFTMTTERLLKIKFGNDINLMMGDTEINFDDFYFEFYAFSTLSKPSYTYEEEATQRGGYTFIESQVSKKTYKASFLADEHICDRLRLIRLCSEKVITDFGKDYKALTFNFNPEWQEMSDLANVSIEFEVDNVISRTGGYTDKDLFKRDYDDSFNQSFR